MTRFLDDVKSEVDAIDDFPEQTELPVVAELGRTDAVVSIAITGPEDPVVLKAYAEDVKSRLQTLREFSTVTIKGFSTHQIRIEVDAPTLRRYRAVCRRYRQCPATTERRQPDRRTAGRAGERAAALR